MDGATAWQLIERHADNWQEIRMMMEAWLRANVAEERNACHMICRDLANRMKTMREKDAANSCAEAIYRRPDSLLANSNSTTDSV